MRQFAAPPRLPSPWPYPLRGERVPPCSYLPRATRTEQTGQIPRPPLVLGGGELPADLGAVLPALDGAEHPDGGGRGGPDGQAGQGEGEGGLGALLVVDQQGVLPHVG